MENIKSTTPIRDFVEIYNSNNAEIINLINNLNDNIQDVDTLKRDLLNTITKSFNQMTAQFQEFFDKKMDEFDSRYVKK